jgi:cell division septation protein DedD
MCTLSTPAPPTCSPTTAEAATEAAPLASPEEEMSYAKINEAAEQARQFIEELVAQDDQDRGSELP